MAGCVVKVANSQKVHIMFFVVGIRTWDSSIPGTSAVTVAKSSEADVLVYGGDRLCGEGSAFSKGIMSFDLGIRTWDSSTLGCSAMTVNKSL